MIFLASKILISRRDLTWRLAEILGEVRPPRLWDLAKILLEILSRFSKSFWPPRFWDLVEISGRISTRFWDLGEKLGEFLAAEILRSRQDLLENLDEILRSCRDLGENLGDFLAAQILRSRRDLAEISPRSWQSRWPKTCRDSRRDLAEISVKILQGFAQILTFEKGKVHATLLCATWKLCRKYIKS